MQLLERETQQKALRAAFDEVQRREGRIVLVSGEAGIGKTALVSGFVGEQRQKPRVFWGACDPLFTPRPLGPFYDIALQGLADLADRLGAGEGPGRDWLAIAAALVKALQELPGAAILVIEDIHWADEATLDLLKHLGRRIQQAHTLLILTYREDEMDAQQLLKSTLGYFPAELTVRLPLPPLSAAAVEALARPSHHEAADVYAVTKGNPFFVTEVLKNGGESVPATIRDAVLSRVARLPAPARAVLELASIVPGGIEPWLLEAVLHPDPAALDACTAGGFLLRAAEGGLVFRHELARLAIEGSLAYGRSRELHRSVLQALRERGPGEVSLAQLVHYAARADDGQAVLEFAPPAAREASQHGAHREAARHYQTAFLSTALHSPLQRAGLLEQLSFEYYLTGRIEQAIQIRREANEIWRQIDQPVRAGDGLRWLSRLHWFHGDRLEAEQNANAAVALLEQFPPGQELAMAYSNRSQLYVLAEDCDPAIAWGQKALDLAQQLGNTEIALHALSNIGTAEMMLGNAAGPERLVQALRMARDLEMHDHVARCYANLGTTAVRDHDYPLAKAYLDEGIAYTSDRDLDSYSVYLRGWRARWRFEQGRWPEAIRDAEEALSNPSASAVMSLPAVIALGHIRARQGHPEAGDLLDRARDLALPTGELQRIGPTAAARAEAAWWSGDPNRARAEARAGYDLALRSRDLWELGLLAWWLWRAGETFGVPEQIPEVYRQMIAGDWGAAAQEWERMGCPFERALALAGGDRAARLAALSIFEGLGARPAAAWLRDVLRGQGEKDIPRGPRPATRANPAGLTAREAEVLALIAAGMSNAAIAGRLSLSQKTVGHHVSAILAKLDVHTRAEAAAAARKFDLPSP